MSMFSRWLSRVAGVDALASKLASIDGRLRRLESEWASDTSIPRMIHTLTVRLEKLERRAGQTDHRLMQIGKPQDGDFKIIENHLIDLAGRLSAIESIERRRKATNEVPTVLTQQ